MTISSMLKYSQKGVVSLLALTAMNIPGAHATSFNVFDAFNGTAVGVPGSGYTFGYTSAGSFGGTLTAFNSTCTNSEPFLCANAAAAPEAKVSKATVNGGSYDSNGSNFFDAGELNFHPGQLGENSGFQFTAATPGNYAYDIGLSVNDTATAFHSVDYRLFQGTTLLASGILDGGLSASLTGNANTSNGNIFTFLIGANGDFRYDSTGVAATFSDTIPPVVGAVPEPASWAMLIVGFGAVGGVMRRRQRPNVRFATT